MVKQVLRVGIAGLGTVGDGVAQLIQTQQALIASRCGKHIEITAVSARDKRKKRQIALGGITWYDNAPDMADDAQVDVVVELIGGDSGAAYELCERALKAKKHVVTANKALIAKHGVHFAKLAEEHGVALAFEAAVAGGIPVIKALKEGLVANQVSKVAGIMNGTCNYILTKMQETGHDFALILAEAQALGYAESDPTFDVDGIDTGHKLAILSAIAFGTPVDFDHVYMEGIRHITVQDIHFAKELGYKIKLLGIASINEGVVEQAVYPAMIPLDYPIANVDGVDNAIYIECHALGKLVLVGPGAGRLPTASSVLSDIADIAMGRRSCVFNQPTATLVKKPAQSIQDHVCEYYIRLQVEDKTGVLAQITDVLNQEGISMEALLQKAPKATENVTIVGITHRVQEKTMRQALAKLAKIGSVLEEPRVIRIEAISE